jgi:hypothetical protein
VTVELNPTWLMIAAVVPLVGALLAAVPLWLLRLPDEVGSIVGAGVVLVCVVGFIAREYGEVLAVTARCIEANIGCRFQPQPFVRYGIFGAIGMIQVLVLFVVGLLLEERLRERDRHRLAHSNRQA